MEESIRKENNQCLETFDPMNPDGTQFHLKKLKATWTRQVHSLWPHSAIWGPKHSAYFVKLVCLTAIKLKEKETMLNHTKSWKNKCTHGLHFFVYRGPTGIVKIQVQVLLTWASKRQQHDHSQGCLHVKGKCNTERKLQIQMWGKHNSKTATEVRGLCADNQSITDGVEWNFLPSGKLYVFIKTNTKLFALQQNQKGDYWK